MVNKEKLSENFKNNIKENVIDKYARQALRTIWLAYKDLEEDEGGQEHDEMDRDGINRIVEARGLTLIAILGIRDVVRPGVQESIRLCQKAGIKVRMITGDSKITAVTIAKQCGILTSSDHEDTVLSGPEFYEKVGGLDSEDGIDKIQNKEAFLSVYQNLCVLSRSRPEDKYLLTLGIKEFGDVVAVTGDGTNDAPALRKADIGIAMGVSGTDVAKHAADIIILDDNFSSLVKSCLWGRNIFDNIRKFIQFQLTCGISAMIITFVCSSLIREAPFKTIQLLWINLIMDSLASLALATEQPTKSLLERDPYPRNEYI